MFSGITIVQRITWIVPAPRSQSYRFFHPVYLLSSYLSSTKVSSTHFKPRCFHVPSHKTTLGVNVIPLSLNNLNNWAVTVGLLNNQYGGSASSVGYYCDLAQCSSSSDSTPETPKGRQDLTIRLGKNMGPPYQLARPHVVRFFPSELGNVMTSLWVLRHLTDSEVVGARRSDLL